MPQLDPQKTAFIFPGQGSQSLGMGQDLASAYPIARATFALADALLGFSLSDIAWSGPEENLNDTVNTQPALLVHSIAALRVFQETYPDFKPAFVAGHSLGELSALVAAGALQFNDALALTRRRGELMKEAGERSPGGMAALLGLSIETAHQACEQASLGQERVQIANDNCPGQVVVSGAGAALRRLLPLAQEAGARKIVPLAVSIAAHSYLMAHAQEGFNQAVNAAQLTSSVRWTESVMFMLEHGVDTFVEIGTGDVLSGLIKRIDRSATRIQLGTGQAFSALAS
jgi:[acyl-carrier-protein] S-malonyltransferase